jgi:hypothetical protein
VSEGRARGSSATPLGTEAQLTRSVALDRVAYEVCELHVGIRVLASSGKGNDVVEGRSKWVRDRLVAAHGLVTQLTMPVVTLVDL